MSKFAWFEISYDASRQQATVEKQKWCLFWRQFSIVNPKSNELSIWMDGRFCLPDIQINFFLVFWSLGLVLIGCHDVSTEKWAT